MPKMTSRVLSVNVTTEVHEEEWTAPVGRTGIDKRPVEGRVLASNNSLFGDVVADRKSHGGYDKAVYSYAIEDAKWWEAKLECEITFGRFGENLTTEGIDLTQAVIGERWRIGTSVLEVSEPRIPCKVFAGFWNRPGLVKEFTVAGRPGAYLRILQEGELSGGDEITILHRPEHGVTISDLFAAKAGERSRIADIVEVPELSERIREWAKQILDTTK